MQIQIVKTLGGNDRSNTGAFPAKDTLEITLKIPRDLELVSPRMAIAPDGGDDCEILPEYRGFDGENDDFLFALDLGKMGEDGYGGLYYYEFRFDKNYKTYYTASVNNVEFSLADRPSRRFLLLLYEPDFTTPHTYYGTTMYHIFVDRFAKGTHETPVRADARLDPDWAHGSPEYAPYPGAHLENNQFFGGSLWGVLDKLDYLESLSVGCIYLSPIFKAYSNHKYDTGDYDVIDEMFGGREAFDALLAECRRRGIRVILDGVFNHTGDDSRYFNRYGKYDSLGAFQSEQSPYHDWYNFIRFPSQYECWWGIPILPKLNIRGRDCRNFFVGENGVCARYIRAGAGGWRLDVADELTDDFLDRLRAVVKAENPDALIVGEVWENAAEKVSYGARRRYLRGRQLDSVMNYPMKNAIISYVQSGDCTMLYNTAVEIYASYPRAVCDCLMNILGTHDTARILTALAGEDPEGKSNDELAHLRLSEDARAYGTTLLKLAAVLQYTLYGFPSVFYGDEAGTEGYRDPFCRMPFPWGHENGELLAHYRALGKLRRTHSAFAGGDFRITAHDCGLFAYIREDANETIHIALNRASFPIHFDFGENFTDLVSGETGSGTAVIEPYGFRIIQVTKKGQ